MAVDIDAERLPASAPRRVIVQLRTPSLRGVARLVVIVGACAGALYLLYLTRDVLKLMLIALFTAMALGPVVDAVQRARLPRAWAIVVVYLACAAAVIGVGALIVPSIGSQVSRLSRDAEHSVGDLRRSATFRRYDDRYHISAAVQTQLRALPSRAGDAAGPLKAVTVGVLGFLSDLVAVLSIAFLLILHGDRYAESALGALSPERGDRWRRVGPQVYRAVSGYVLGNLAISVIAGSGAWLAMRLLGVPFAVPLAIVIGFLDLIPMVGATLGAILVAVAALVVSPLAAVLWLVYIFIYQQVENYLIQPVVYRRAIKVNPLATIIAILVGATLLGLLGALLAIPAAATVQLVADDIRRPPMLDGSGPA